MSLYFAWNPVFDCEHVVYVIQEHEDFSHVNSLTLLEGWQYPTKDLRPFIHTASRRLELIVARYRVLPRYGSERHEHLQEYRAVLNTVLTAEGLTLADLFGTSIDSMSD